METNQLNRTFIPKQIIRKSATNINANTLHASICFFHVQNSLKKLVEIPIFNLNPFKSNLMAIIYLNLLLLTLKSLIKLPFLSVFIYCLQHNLDSVLRSIKKDRLLQGCLKIYKLHLFRMYININTMSLKSVQKQIILLSLFMLILLFQKSDKYFPN